MIPFIEIQNRQELSMIVDIITLLALAGSVLTGKYHG